MLWPFFPCKMAPFWTIPRAWPGETAFILGGGPSLKGFDGGQLAGRRVITINNSWELCPAADILYFCDGRWWDQHGDRVKQQFRGDRIVTISKTVRDSNVFKLQNAIKERGLTENRSALVHGSNSGYQAINLAYLLGAARIVLLGYDMNIRTVDESSDGTHWHRGHPGQIRDNFNVRIQKVFLPRMKELIQPLAAAGVEVLNATPGSAIDWWPRIDLKEAL